jgi:hypothetical protein
MKTGIATFGLDYGTCPRWLFEKMKRLARLIGEAIVYEFGPEEFIKRLSDPFFFQSFGTVLAFDWDASGLTTTTTAAIKEALRGTENHLGIFVAGGKGKTSLKTPIELDNYGQKFSFNTKPLVYASKIAAKVDNSALQDGYSLYHHCFLFTKKGRWTVVQQGMNTRTRRARRYHWYSGKVKDFVEEPHAGIRDTGMTNAKCQMINEKVLNLVSKKSRKTRKTSANLVSKEFSSLKNDVKVLNYVGEPFNRGRLEKTLNMAHEIAPEDFEELLTIKGVGPRTIRALSLIAEIVYGTKPSYSDPARYAYAHGGKDGIPYPVDRKTYETSIHILERAVKKAKIGHYDMVRTLRKLQNRRYPQQNLLNRSII